jgi:hypothetical protein
MSFIIESARIERGFAGKIALNFLCGLFSSILYCAKGSASDMRSQGDVIKF